MIVPEYGNGNTLESLIRLQLNPHNPLIIGIIVSAVNQSLRCTRQDGRPHESSVKLELCEGRIGWPRLASQCLLQMEALIDQRLDLTAHITIMRSQHIFITESNQNNI